ITLTSCNEPIPAPSRKKRVSNWASSSPVNTCCTSLHPNLTRNSRRRWRRTRARSNQRECRQNFPAATPLRLGFPAVESVPRFSRANLTFWNKLGGSAICEDSGVVHHLRWIGCAKRWGLALYYKRDLCAVTRFSDPSLSW